MEKKLFAFASVLVGFCCLVIFSSFHDKETIQPDTTNVSPGLQQHIASFDLDKPFSFAGESIPVDNFDALERLDRELIINTYLHSALLLNIKLANRY
ncbi:MAG TPA: lytic transglycosylase domain-containing protein, partial [Saprospiraceae bacterium]|nr:lytic transglycosylase domain-containing protein [Saprospiraceae bacterium]